MQRGWHPEKPLMANQRFVFNSEDTSGHPWGDFCLTNRNPTVFVIDGKTLPVITTKTPWVFFHRDKDGIIDHLFQDLTRGRPDESWDSCPICKGEKHKRKGE